MKLKLSCYLDFSSEDPSFLSPVATFSLASLSELLASFVSPSVFSASSPSSEVSGFVSSTSTVGGTRVAMTKSLSLIVGWNLRVNQYY